MGILGFFECKLLYLKLLGSGALVYVQHREKCMIGSLFCTAEPEETLLINYTLIIIKIKI